MNSFKKMKPLKLIEYCVFVVSAVTLMLFGSIAFTNAQEETKQETHGSQSPAIIANGDVTIIYMNLPKEERELLFKQPGNKQQLIDRLLRELAVKNADLEDSRAEIQKWVKKYEELKIKISQISENSEQSTKAKAEAKAALIEGDLKKAESAITIQGGSFSGGSIN